MLLLFLPVSRKICAIICRDVRCQCSRLAAKPTIMNWFWGDRLMEIAFGPKKSAVNKCTLITTKHSNKLEQTWCLYELKWQIRKTSYMFWRKRRGGGGREDGKNFIGNTSHFSRPPFLRLQRYRLGSQLILWVFPAASYFLTSLNPKIKIWILICCPSSFPTEVVGRSW